MDEKNNTKKEITLEELAMMVQNGFTELRTEFKADFRSVDKKLNEISVDVSEIKVALNKKVDKFEHKDLEYRVEKLENKFA